MPNVRINSLKNRLYITLRDWGQADMFGYVQKTESAVKGMKLGAFDFELVQSIAYSMHFIV